MTTTRTVRAWVAVWAGVSAVSAAAGTLPFSADFESGTLLTSDAPPGVWEQQAVPPSSQNQVIAAAAHRGAFGYRALDMDTTGGAGDQIKASLSLSVQASSVYARSWFRIAAESDLGAGIQFFLIAANVASQNDLTRLELFGSDNRLSILGRDRPGTLVGTPAGNLDAGTWHLLEMTATGLGTASGARVLYIDGVQAAAKTGIDWSGSSPQITIFVIGENYADQRSATATLDYDDVRMDTRPLASTLTVKAPAAAQTSACIPLTISLVDSISGAEAPAPYDMVVDVAVSGGSGALYDDASCSTGGPVTLSLGTSSTAVYLRATGPATLTLTASHADFLPGEARVELGTEAPDAGTGPLTYELSCSSASGPALWPLALAVLWARRRFSSRARGSSCPAG